MRSMTAALIFGLSLASIAGQARADCSHADYQDKYDRVQALIMKLYHDDPAKSAALAQQVADIEAQNQGDIYGLGHACGAYDVILMKSGQ